MGVDPGSQKAGWAIKDDGVLINHGIIKARRASKTRYDERSEDIADRLQYIFWKYLPGVVVVEIPNKTQSKRKYTTKAGEVRDRPTNMTQHIYASGVQVRALREAWFDDSTTYVRDIFNCVMPCTWTAKCRKKIARQEKAAELYPQYDPATDKGGDASDAIMLIEWFQEQEKQK
ncbi:MAG: crossover junction endodeoxyribonuclease RuvC [Rhodobacteraceae bacterium]|nr:crossover junction endodeoxyribonuclease RuvC [Paracoccaceae bacterium]